MDSHKFIIKTRGWDDNACLGVRNTSSIGAWHNYLDWRPLWYCIVSPLLHKQKTKKQTLTLHIFLKFLDREPLRRSDPPSEKISSFPSRMRDDISRPKFKIHEEFNKDWLMNFDSGRMQTTKRTTTTTSEYLFFIKPALWILKSKT